VTKAEQLQSNKKIKKKTRSRANIKKTAWKWFSLFIRARDCLQQTKGLEGACCTTCGQYFKFKELQAGHCIGGRSDAILFDEKLVNVQCGHCNKSVGYGGLGGNYPKYHIWYIEKYGMDDFKQREALSNQVMKLDTQQLLEISDYYRLKYKELIK